jgi:type II secretory ATPase GspE/PulE/Tfp pilus assembly ATPase PilB-like protein
MTPLQREALRRGILPPGQATLRRYGLTAPEWLSLLAAQEWRCPVCLKGSATTRWNTDHDHVPRWKFLSPEERKRHVRGVLCAYCNHRRVNSRMTALEASRIADYLAAYEARRSA